MISERWKNDNYRGNIPFLFNSEIYEYDMKEAGFSLIQEFGLLPEMVIDNLKKYKKEQRKIEIGMLQRDSQEFTKNLNQAFKDARYSFFVKNDIEDNDIVAIKKDAIFLNRKIKHEEFGKYIDFRIKNKYSAYVGVLDNIELYYVPGDMDMPGRIDVKGINDDKVKLHEGYMLELMAKFIHRMQSRPHEEVTRYMRDIIDKYKRKELDIGYYREFSFRSKFRDRHGDYYDEYWPDEIDELDITYNFYNILIKLIQITL